MAPAVVEVVVLAGGAVAVPGIDGLLKLGRSGRPNSELIFNDVKVPKENLLGKEGQGFTIAMATLDGGRIGKFEL